MTSETVGAFVVGAVVAADLLLLFCLGLLVRILPAVRRLSAAARVLETTTLDVPLGEHEPLGVMSSRLLFDLLEPKRRVLKTLTAYLRFPIGRLIIIVHTGDATIKRIVKELQWYAFLIAMLFVAGTIMRATELTELTAQALVHDIGQHPFHFLDQLALFALITLAFRLGSEVSRLSELLLPPQ